MGRRQADLLGPQTQDLGRAPIGLRCRLIGLGHFRAEDRVPGQPGALRHGQQQRDIAVGERRDDIAPLEAGQPGHRIRPRVEPVPGLVQRVELRRRHPARVEIEFGQRGLQIFPMQHVQPDEAPPAVAHRRHGRIVTPAPGIGEFGRIDGVRAVTFEQTRRLPGDAAPPIDHGAEHVEYHGFQMVQRHVDSLPYSQVKREGP
jgi:hypothetical protein